MDGTMAMVSAIASYSIHGIHRAKLLVHERHPARQTSTNDRINITHEPDPRCDSSLHSATALSTHSCVEVEATQSTSEPVTPSTELARIVPDDEPLAEPPEDGIELVDSDGFSTGLLAVVYSVCIDRDTGAELNNDDVVLLDDEDDEEADDDAAAAEREGRHRSHCAEVPT